MAPINITRRRFLKVAAAAGAALALPVVAAPPDVLFTDPVSGISIRLPGTLPPPVRYDIIYGFAPVRADLVCRVLG